MSRAKWVEGQCDSFGYWHEFRLPNGMGYSIDVSEGIYCAQFLTPDNDTPIGSARKTLRAAHNDCKRHAKKLRAALVEFDRAKLP